MTQNDGNIADKTIQKIKELNAIVDGSSEIRHSSGGQRTFIAKGTFDGATVKVELMYEGIGWVDAGTDTTFTEDGVANFTVNVGVQYRVTIESAGASTDVSYAVVAA